MSKTRSVTTDNYFGSFLSNIGKYEVLTAKEEKRLGRLIQRKVALDKKLPKELEKASDRYKAEYFSINEEKYREIVQRGIEARDRLIKHNLKLVVHISKRFTRKGVDIRELVQAGTIGLSRAAEKFNPEKGIKFSTYAGWWIKQALYPEININRKQIRIPTEYFYLFKKIKKAQLELQVKTNKNPTAKDIASYLGVKESRIKTVLSSYYTTVSRDQKVIKEEEIASYQEPVQRLSDSKEENPKLFVKSALSSLTEQERYIVTRKFGLEGEKELTYTEIGREIGFSAGWVRQITVRSVNKIRKLCDVQNISMENFSPLFE